MEKLAGNQPLSILVYGAGVLGSLYAGRLAAAGHAVTLLARGKRLAELEANGVILEEERTGARLVTRPRLVDALAPDSAYDYVLVLVRKNQLASVLPALAASTATPNVVFMVNSAAGAAEYTQALGRERVLLGFPGAGGTRQEGVVRYRLVSRQIQQTNLGEVDGRRTPRLERLGAALTAAGFPVTYCDNMDAWLKTHVALVSPIANAIYFAGDNYRLAADSHAVYLMLCAIREGFAVLKKLGVPITPGRFARLLLLPDWLLVPVLRPGLATKAAELVMTRHALSARDEMKHLAEEFQALAAESGVPTPALDELARHIDLPA